MASAPTATTTTDDFIDMLTAIRSKRVAESNEAYHKAMAAIVAKTRQTMDLPALRKDLIEQAHDDPFSTAFGVSVRVDLTPLFAQATKPLEIWFRGGHYIFDGYSDKDAMEAFAKYLYWSDPDIAELRRDISAVFPDARIMPDAYLRNSETAILAISITYFTPWRMPEYEAGPLTDAEKQGYTTVVWQAQKQTRTNHLPVTAI
jgi:hypothetical protein